VAIGDIGEACGAVYDGLGGPEEALFSSERIFSLVVKELRLRVAQLSFTDQEIFSVARRRTRRRRASNPSPPSVRSSFVPAFADVGPRTPPAAALRLLLSRSRSSPCARSTLTP
jgi:hypothetical protein